MRAKSCAAPLVVERRRSRRRPRLPRPPLRRGFEPRHLLLARAAVRRPEVDDDRLAAERGERQRRPTAEARQPERGAGDDLSVQHGLRASRCPDARAATRARRRGRRRLRRPRLARASCGERLAGSPRSGRPDRIGPFTCGGITCPCGSTKNVSGKPVTPHVLSSMPTDVAYDRVVDVVARSCNGSRRPLRSLPSTPTNDHLRRPTWPPRRAAFSPRACSRHTTTPRSSGRRPCLDRRRDRRCRAAAEERQRGFGGGDGLPLVHLRGDAAVTACATSQTSSPSRASTTATARGADDAHQTM